MLSSTITSLQFGQCNPLSYIIHYFAIAILCLILFITLLLLSCSEFILRILFAIRFPYPQKHCNFYVVAYFLKWLPKPCWLCVFRHEKEVPETLLNINNLLNFFTLPLISLSKWEITRNQEVIRLKLCLFYFQWDGWLGRDSAVTQTVKMIQIIVSGKRHVIHYVFFLLSKNVFFI